MIGDAAAFHRFGLGPRPGDLSRFQDLRAAMHDELESDSIALIDGPNLVDAPGALLALNQYRAQQQDTAPEPMRPAMDAAQTRPAAPMAERQLPPQQSIYLTEFGARLRKYQATDIGFVERLVAFWTNHFAIEASAGPLERTLVGVFEREAIRPFVLGNFRDMLDAVTKHPAMLAYLDNAQSVGPNSVYGIRAGVGLNENHARELLELHTVGVNAGYTQADVTAMARVFTGWSFNGREGQGNLGEFVFRFPAHEPGVQTIMGVEFAAGGVEQGEAVLDMLAAHPATAQHIAFKLVRHFVADEPPAELVDTIAHAFLTTGGDLKATAMALIDDDGAYADPTKIKTPQIFAWSALRALGLALPPQQVQPGLAALGQPM